MGFFKHFLNPQKIQTITSLKAPEISISYSPNRPFCSIVLALNNCNKLTVFLVLAATQSAPQHMLAITSSHKKF